MEYVFTEARKLKTFTLPGTFHGKMQVDGVTCLGTLGVKLVGQNLVILGLKGKYSNMFSRELYIYSSRSGE